MSFTPKLFQWIIFVLILVMAILATGCSVKTEIIIGDHRQVTGNVTLADTDIPMIVRLLFDGPKDTVFYTNRNGYYGGLLRSGEYTVYVEGAHEYGSRDVSVTKNEKIDLVVNPYWFDWDLFRAISGLRQYYYDQEIQGLNYTNGELAHWEKSQVRIFFETNPPSYYKSEITTWNSNLSSIVQLQETYYLSNADIKVEFVEEIDSPDPDDDNPLVTYAGIAHFLAYYENGSLQNVLIQIDNDYRNASGLWEHLLAEAMGVNHSTDTNSVLHPVVRPNQRTYISNNEWNHIKLLYDVPSGLTLLSGFSAMSLDQEENGVSVVPSSFTGYKGHIITEEGNIIELTPAEVFQEMGR